MSIIDSNYLKLISEFSEIKIDVEIQDDSYLLAKDGDLSNLIVYYRYIIRFQHDFIVYDTIHQQVKVRDAYFKSIQKLANMFYREINDIIELEGTDLIVYNKISDIYLHFKEIDGFYFQNNHTKLWEHKHTNENYTYLKDSQEQSVDLGEVDFFLQSAYKIQKDTIAQILLFLKEKLKMLELFKDQTTSKSNPDKTSNKKALERLDRYQTALVFDYLAKAGIIHSHSYNIISKLVSQLTGHSQKTFRSLCFNQIWQIKSGQQGNKIEIKKNPAYNLEKVKDAFDGMMKEITSDIRKNQESLQHSKM